MPGPQCGAGRGGVHVVKIGGVAGHSDQNITSVAEEAILGWEEVPEWLGMGCCSGLGAVGSRK